MWKLFICFLHNRQRFTKGKVEAKGIVSKFTLAWRLHSSSDTQLWSLPELCCSCAWPCALLTLPCTHWFHLRPPVSVVLPQHHGLSWLWLSSPNLLCSFKNCLYWWGQCLWPCCSPWITHLWGEASLTAPDRCVPRYLGNFISGKNTT